jgi:hypothetical protein
MSPVVHVLAGAAVVTTGWLGGTVSINAGGGFDSPKVNPVARDATGRTIGNVHILESTGTLVRYRIDNIPFGRTVTISLDVPAISATGFSMTAIVTTPSGVSHYETRLSPLLPDRDHLDFQISPVEVPPPPSHLLYYRFTPRLNRSS